MFYIKLKYHCSLPNGSTSSFNIQCSQVTNYGVKSLQVEPFTIQLKVVYKVNYLSAYLHDILQLLLQQVSPLGGMIVMLQQLQAACYDQPLCIHSQNGRFLPLSANLKWKRKQSKRQK